MIQFITTGQTLSIRSEVLREGRLSAEECHFDGDDLEGTFHLGYFTEDKLVCIATFHSRSLSDFEGKGFRLRGMATVDGYRGMGFGNKVLNFAIEYLKGQKVNYLWCSARKVAFNFYQQLGFQFISNQYEVPGIGPHKDMYLKIQ
ncbi:GNAT family N-acetyltransferase [Rubrolithibacter danxiaensis]|uniref:GNAT family N-acetyltransferase n=1 Tax=Rubrolithibacter danxiaensis TaxID=3390805 RepID=UPI003BF78644